MEKMSDIEQVVEYLGDLAEHFEAEAKNLEGFVAKFGYHHRSQKIWDFLAYLDLLRQDGYIESFEDTECNECGKKGLNSHYLGCSKAELKLKDNSEGGHNSR